MAHLAEDESAGMADKPWPRAGEKWLHPESGHVVTVEWLHVLFVGCNKGETVWFYDFELLAKSDIPPRAQCVVFEGDNNQKYVQTVENFLQRFEGVG